jgi:hypothetical protein
MNCRRSTAAFVVMPYLLATSVLGADGEPTTEGATATAPTCAVIAGHALGLADSPLVALLETQLSAGGSVRLLERADIDKVLAEQELGLLLAPEGGARRIALGKLIRAHMLVLLQARTRDDEARYIDVVVCETNSGLRLRVTSIAWSDQPETDAAQLNGLVEHALSKYRAPVRHVFAVPPFVGSDFLHKYDYLQNVYAVAIEHVLITRPGIVVVELAEARTIAEELALAGDEQAVARNLPYYILGEYKIEQIENQSKAWLQLSLRRREREIEARRQIGVPIDEVIPSLQTMAQSLIEDIIDSKTAVLEPAAEVQQLVARAADFKRLREWTQAYNLIEAALLLQPSNPDLLAEAIDLVERNMVWLSRPSGLYWRELSLGDPVDEYLGRGALALDYCRRGIDLTERWLNAVDINPNAELSIPSGVRMGIGYWTKGRAVVEAEVEVQQKLSDLDVRYCDMLFRVLERRAAAGEVGEKNAKAFAERIGLNFEDPFSEHARRYIRIAQRIPGTDAEIIALTLEHVDYFFVTHGTPIEMTKELALELLNDKATRRIEEIARLPGGSAQVAAQRMREMQSQAISFLADLETRCIETTVRSREKLKGTAFVYYRNAQHRLVYWRVKRGDLSEVLPGQKPEAQLRRDIAYHPLELRFTAEGEPTSPAGIGPILTGWRPGPNDIDLAWSAQQVFAMKKKGLLNPLYTLRVPLFDDLRRIRDPLYDGECLWIAEETDDPAIVVIDVASERAYRLTASNGLPPVHLGLCVAPVGPRKACAAAAFGKPESGRRDYDRTWVAAIELLRNGQFVVDILLQADVLPTRGPHRQRGRTPTAINTVFLPGEMIALPDGAPESTGKVLLRRTIPDVEPLLIDPATRTIKAIDERVPKDIRRETRFTHQGWLYYFADHTLMRVNALNVSGEAFPTLDEVSSSQAPIEHLRTAVEHEGTVYGLSADGKILIAKCCGAPLRLTQGHPHPHSSDWSFERLCSSHHYGLILLTYSRWTETPPGYQLTVSEAALTQSREEGEVYDGELAAWRVAREATRDRILKSVAQTPPSPHWIAILLTPQLVFSLLGVAAAGALLLYLVRRARSRRT